MIPKCKRLIDVGCDHGKLCFHALTENIVSSALGIDISEASLDKAKQLFNKFGLMAEFIQNDGLKGIKSSSQSVIAICGMGGELISKILSESPDAAQSAEALILQPNGGEKELRNWLYNNGYIISDESIINDMGRYYQLIRAEYDPTLPAIGCDPVYMEFGEIAYKKRIPEYLDMLKKTLAIREKRMEKAVSNGTVPRSLVDGINNINTLISNWEVK